MYKREYITLRHTMTEGWWNNIPPCIQWYIAYITAWLAVAPQRFQSAADIPIA